MQREIDVLMEQRRKEECETEKSRLSEVALARKALVKDVKALKKDKKKQEQACRKLQTGFQQISRLQKQMNDKKEKMDQLIGGKLEKAMRRKEELTTEMAEESKKFALTNARLEYLDGLDTMLSKAGGIPGVSGQNLLREASEIGVDPDAQGLFPPQRPTQANSKAIDPENSGISTSDTELPHEEFPDGTVQALRRSLLALDAALSSEALPELEGTLAAAIAESVQVLSSDQPLELQAEQRDELITELRCELEESRRELGEARLAEEYMQEKLEIFEGLGAAQRGEAPTSAWGDFERTVLQGLVDQFEADESDASPGVSAVSWPTSSADSPSHDGPWRTFADVMRKKMRSRLGSLGESDSGTEGNQTALLPDLRPAEPTLGSIREASLQNFARKNGFQDLVNFVGCGTNENSTSPKMGRKSVESPRRETDRLGPCAPPLGISFDQSSRQRAELPNLRVSEENSADNYQARAADRPMQTYSPCVSLSKTRLLARDGADNGQLRQIERLMPGLSPRVELSKPIFHAAGESDSSPGRSTEKTVLGCSPTAATRLETDLLESARAESSFATPRTAIGSSLPDWSPRSPCVLFDAPVPSTRLDGVMKESGAGHYSSDCKPNQFESLPAQKTRNDLAGPVLPLSSKNLKFPEPPPISDGYGWLPSWTSLSQASGSQAIAAVRDELKEVDYLLDANYRNFSELETLRCAREPTQMQLGRSLDESPQLSASSDWQPSLGDTKVQSDSPWASDKIGFVVANLSSNLLSGHAPCGARSVATPK